MIARPPTPDAKPATTPPLRPGANVLLGRNPLGVWVQGPSGGSGFSHPFTVMASGSGVRVSKGLVIANITAEPCIDKVPISGNTTTRQPVLNLDDSAVDDLNQSWVCVEVTPNADGKLDATPIKPQVVVVQRKYPLTLTGKFGRMPLALLLRKNNTWQVYQIAYFNFRYEAVNPASGPRKHFFL